MNLTETIARLRELEAKATAGEVGEACNVIKKLERERHGWRGSRATVGQLAEELADVVICADLAAPAAGVDLEEAVRATNATSAKNNLATRLPARPVGSVVVPAGHLREAMRFYPKHDSDVRTRLIGNELRDLLAARPGAST